MGCERLYCCVEALVGNELAGKVSGMLLDGSKGNDVDYNLSVSDQIWSSSNDLSDQKTWLARKVSEALVVLHNNPTSHLFTDTKLHATYIRLRQRMYKIGNILCYQSLAANNP